MTPFVQIEWDLPDSINDKPGYGIWVEGNLAMELVEWLDHDVSVHNLDSGDALLFCPTTDQAALFGVLVRLNNLGLKILAMQRFPLIADHAGQQ